MIEINGVKKKYKTTVALKGVNTRINRGEIFLLIGPNGAGKSTLMKIILGVLFPGGGNVQYDKNLSFGYMPEDPIGKPGWTVEKYLKVIANLAGIDKKKLTNKLETNFERFKIGEKRHSVIKELSRGQKQMVKLLQALIPEPDVLVLDEPTAGLDPIGKIEMRRWIAEEKSRGKTIIISSHSLDEMEKIGDRFMILVNGEKKDEGIIGEFPGVDLESHFYSIVGKGGR